MLLVLGGWTCALDYEVIYFYFKCKHIHKWSCIEKIILRNKTQPEKINCKIKLHLKMAPFTNFFAIAIKIYLNRDQQSR